jgi:hypothetical protein
MKALSHQPSLDAFDELSSEEDLTLEDVFERVEDGCREAVALKFSNAVLTIKVDPDSDTMEVRCQRAELFDTAGMTSVRGSPAWVSLVGQVFGWGWVTINQQGYQDGVVLSFDGLEPNVMLTAAGSSIRIYSISPKH